MPWATSFVIMMLACTSCATVHYQERPFFVEEQGLETHGRKTWFDHLVEFDPGRIKTTVADDYAQNPPQRIAVLPFVDRGSAQFVVNKVPLSFRNEDEQSSWAWTYANRLRRALTGYLAQREFSLVNIYTVDTVLRDHGVTNGAALESVSPAELGRWIGADAVVYGEVTNYEAYYLFLFADWQVGVDVRMISTKDGHEFFSAHGSRYSVDLRPAFSIMDMGINSALTLLQLRDVNLARAEDEVGREITLRLPVAKRNVAALIEEAKAEHNGEAGEPIAHAALVTPAPLGQNAGPH